MKYIYIYDFNILYFTLNVIICKEFFQIRLISSNLPVYHYVHFLLLFFLLFYFISYSSQQILCWRQLFSSIHRENANIYSNTLNQWPGKKWIEILICKYLYDVKFNFDIFFSVFFCIFLKFSEICLFLLSRISIGDIILCNRNTSRQNSNSFLTFYVNQNAFIFNHFHSSFVTDFKKKCLSL